jgi:GTP cyclohydrolase II
VDKAFDNWCILPTSMGEFRMYDTGDEGVRVICRGDLKDQGIEPLLRVHSSCLASEVFGSLDCDCADQLREAMKRIAAEDRGLIIHLNQEGRGQGLSQKIRAIRKMQIDGLDTAEAFEAMGIEQDIRCYADAVQVMRKASIDSVRLITNNPRKVKYLTHKGIRVSMVNTHPTIRPENTKYLQTKNSKLGHLLPLDASSGTSLAIHFYHSDQPWGEFSNFSQHAIFCHGRIWPTVEHFYQAQKFVGTRYEEDIRLCKTPTLAKKRASDLINLISQKDWSAVRENVMLKGLRVKFNQHPDLRQKLLASGTRQIIEHTEHDEYWGDAKNGSGQNRLGHLLMRIRAELRQEAEFQRLVS